MNIGIFGGTFDPIHRGHLALARAAQERFSLRRIYFVPASVPPHKQHQQLAPYLHRYAMVVLATIGEKSFIPSLLESDDGLPAPSARSKGKQTSPAGPNYSIDTVRKLKRTLPKSDRLFLLIGMDAFKDIEKWHEAEALLRECEFVVASRAGFSLADVANALPAGLRPADAVTRPFAKQPAKGDLVLPGATIHLLGNVHQNISATAVRDAVSANRSLGKLVDPLVADYIKRLGLYKAARPEN